MSLTERRFGVRFIAPDEQCLPTLEEFQAILEASVAALPSKQKVQGEVWEEASEHEDFLH